MTTRPPTVRDAVRSGDGKVTRELVLATALEIIDRDGADALSMRRLGAALDRDPMILYRHAPGKAALLDGVVETVLAQLHVDPADPDWTAQLRAIARDYRALALAHPNVVPLLVTRPLATPLALRPRGTLRPLEDLLALLTRAGFSGPDALHIYRALFGFLNGHVLNELQELVENPDETDDLLRLGLNRLPLSEFPLLRGLAHALACYDGAAELERGLDILLTGLAATLSPPGNLRRGRARCRRAYGGSGGSDCIRCRGRRYGGTPSTPGQTAAERIARMTDDRLIAVPGQETSALRCMEIARTDRGWERCHRDEHDPSTRHHVRDRSWLSAENTPRLRLGQPCGAACTWPDLVIPYRSGGSGRAA